jgi:surface antigen
MLILEYSQGCYGRMDERTEGRTDGSVTISLRNFIGERIITEWKGAER